MENIAQEEKHQIVIDNWDELTYNDLVELTGYSKGHIKKLGRKYGLAPKGLKGHEEAVKEIVSQERRDLAFKTQITILTRKNKTLMSEANLNEALLSLAKQSIESMPQVRAPRHSSKKIKTIKEVAVLLNSDFHVGENVISDEIGGLNSYNMLVYAKRMQLMSDKIRSIKEILAGYKLSKLYVNCLGDMVSGIIHQELVETADGNVFDWLFNGALIYSQFLAELLTVFETIEVTGVVGNHGRLKKEITFKNRFVNWDYIFYQVVALMLKDNPRIRFDLPRSFWTLKNIGGRNMLLLHGDNIRSWQGIPWYGIQRAAAKLRELLSSQQIIFDDIVLGHFHNAGTLDTANGELLLNGSVVGGNEFSIGALFASSKPRQLFFGVNPKDMIRTWEYKLDLSGEDKITKLRYEMSNSIVVADQVRDLF